jgi:hypothetical protein
VTVPTVPITRASDHPRFSGEDAEQPATKKIDTDAARERIAATRTATRASDKPPTRPKRTADKPTVAPITYSNGMFRAPISSLYEQAGELLKFAIYPVGEVTVQQAPACGAAWDELAKTNPTVRKWLHRMSGTGAAGKLIAAHIPIFMTAMVTLSPTFRERMGGLMTDSMSQMAQSDIPVQDPN